MNNRHLRRQAIALLLPLLIARQPLARADEGPPVAPLPAPPYVAPPPAQQYVAPPAAPQYWGVPSVGCKDDCEKAVPVVMSYRTTPRYGLMIGGAAAFGALYILSAVPMTLATADMKMAIPVAGPMILASHLRSSDSNVFKFWLAMDGLSQAAMLALFVAGAATRKQTPVYERMLLLPSVHAGGGGLTAIGRF